MSNVIELTPPSRPRRADRETDRRRRKADMIARLAAGETVIAAAEAAGIGWRRAYVWRAEDAAFRAAWDQARAQIATRPTVTPYPVPASAPEPPRAPFEVPPSPPRVNRAPRIFRFTAPSSRLSDYDPELAEPGDKVVCIGWSFSRTRPDSVATYTVQDDGNWAMDTSPDLDAYEMVKPAEDERPVVEEPLGT